MKIKSFILAIALLGTAAKAFSQKDLATAKSSYEKYVALRGNKLAVPMLATAKDAIDKAILSDKTNTLAETWAYKALVYGDAALAETTDAAKAESYFNESTSALKKALALDTKGEEKGHLSALNLLLYNYMLNKGVVAYKAEKYADAYTNFDQAETYMPGDTVSNYYAGIAAQNAKRFPDAIKKYTSLLNTNYSLLEDVYSNLSVLYALQKDTVSAIKISGEGARKFPKNNILPAREIEFSLMTGKEKEVINSITAQAAKEPANKLFPYYLGIAYSSIKDFPKAEDAYKKALAIDPNYANAAINLAGLIMNNGIVIYNSANKLDPKKVTEYQAEIKRANAEFDRSLPYLLKAVELDPKSALPLQNLKRYYLIKKDTAKADETQKRIDAIK